MTIDMDRRTFLRGALSVMAVAAILNGRVKQPAPDLYDGEWHTVTATKEGATVRHFVDGVEVDMSPTDDLQAQLTGKRWSAWNRFQLFMRHNPDAPNKMDMADLVITYNV